MSRYAPQLSREGKRRELGRAGRGRLERGYGSGADPSLEAVSVWASPWPAGKGGRSCPERPSSSLPRSGGGCRGAGTRPRSQQRIATERNLGDGGSACVVWPRVAPGGLGYPVPAEAVLALQLPRCPGAVRSRCLTWLHVLLLKPVNTWGRVADLSGVCTLHLQLAGVRVCCVRLTSSFCSVLHPKSLPVFYNT